MNKNTFTSVKLAKGEVNVYDFSGIKLHAYKTNDLSTTKFIVEKTARLSLSSHLASLTTIPSLQTISRTLR